MSQSARNPEGVPSRLVLTCLVALLLVAPAALAQTITFTGDRGSGCIPINMLVPGPHNFVLADIIPAGSFVVITGATSGGASPMSVSDSGANTYVIDSSVVFFATYRIYSISSVRLRQEIT